MEDTVLLLCKTASGKLVRVRVDMLIQAAARHDQLHAAGHEGRL